MQVFDQHPYALKIWLKHIIICNFIIYTGCHIIMVDSTNYDLDQDQGGILIQKIFKYIVLKDNQNTVFV